MIRRRNPAVTDIGTLATDPALIEELGLDDAAEALFNLAALQLAIALHIRHGGRSPSVNRTPTAEDKLLLPEQAAARMGVSRRWLYRHAKRLPFTRRLGRKQLRFSEAGLTEYLAKKNPCS